MPTPARARAAALAACPRPGSRWRHPISGSVATVAHAGVIDWSGTVGVVWWWNQEAHTRYATLQEWQSLGLVEVK